MQDTITIDGIKYKVEKKMFPIVNNTSGEKVGEQEISVLVRIDDTPKEEKKLPKT